MSAPQKGPPDALGSGDRAEADQEKQHSDFTANKAFGTMRAQLAMSGYALHQLSAGGFLVSRWNFARELPDLHAVRAFARAAGVAL